MIPPTSIDGTDITGATIDGTDVTEITVDGQTVFTAGVPIPPSGVFRFEFEGDVTDSWGSNDATDNTSAGFSNTSKTGLQSKDFDGSNDHLRIPNSSDLDDIRSLFAWVRPNGLAPNTFGNTIYNDAATSNGSSDDVRLLRMGRDDGLVRIMDGNNTLSFVPFNQTFDDNEWYHLGFTYATDGTLKVYVDGTEVNQSSSNDGTFLDVNVGANIGARLLDNGSNDRFFAGLIDDLRGYDKELSTAEVSNLFNNGQI